MSNVFDIGKKLAKDGLNRAERAARNAGKPHTDEKTMFVEVTVTFPDGQQSRFGTPIGIDGDVFEWASSKEGQSIRIEGITKSNA